VLLTVHRNVRAHVNTTSVHANLEQSAAVFEDALGIRLSALAAVARADAEDPRLTALVMLEPAERDAGFLGALRSVGQALHRSRPSDLFDVYDRRGRLVVSLGPTAAPRADCAGWVRAALAGEPTAKVAALAEIPCQIAVAPMRAGGHVVGALIVGAPLDDSLATTLRRGLQGEVSFLAGGDVVASTLHDSLGLATLETALAAPSRLPETGPETPATLVAGRRSWLTLVRAIPGSDRDAGLFYALQRANDAEQAFSRRMQDDMLLLGAIAVLLALAAGWIFSRQITRPVLALVRGARAMEHGDFDCRIDVRNRDELGYLAERFRVMRERERAYVERLREAARVKSEFIGVASHELRTPISILLGYHGLLADGGLGATTPEQERALTAMRQCIDRLTRLAEQATQMAQLESVDPGPETRDVGLTPIVVQAIDEAVALAPDRRIGVTRKIDEPLGAARVDPERLRDGLRQIVANAIRFTPDGGEVTVVACGDDQAVLFRIADTGIGMPPERIRALTEGETVVRDSLNHHSSGGLEFGSAGLGFGFAIARAAVELHGGTIEIASAVGRGTTVSIRLPRGGSETIARAA